MCVCVLCVGVCVGGWVRERERGKYSKRRGKHRGWGESETRRTSVGTEKTTEKKIRWLHGIPLMIITVTYLLPTFNGEAK